MKGIQNEQTCWPSGRTRTDTISDRRPSPSDNAGWHHGYDDAHRTVATKHRPRGQRRRPCLARPTTLDDLRDHRQVLRRCCLSSVVLIVRLGDMQCDNIRPWPRMQLRGRP